MIIKYEDKLFDVIRLDGSVESAAITSMSDNTITLDIVFQHVIETHIKIDDLSIDTDILLTVESDTNLSFKKQSDVYEFNSQEDFDMLNILLANEALSGDKLDIDIDAVDDYASVIEIIDDYFDEIADKEHINTQLANAYKSIRVIELSE